LVYSGLPSSSPPACLAAWSTCSAGSRNPRRRPSPMRCSPMDLSVVIPIKDEKENLTPLHERLVGALDPLQLAYEILFVDDGSTDGSHAVLEELAARDARVKVVRLRRNFGQSAALKAGIDHSSGGILVTMDGDLQNDPADIPLLLAKLEE